MTLLEDIKQRLDIVSIVSESVPLTKSGRNYKARCPFHTERTPSFYVFPDGQTWRCFGGCATGGDVFSFVMRQEGLSFPDALRRLGEKTGVQIEERRSSSPAEDHQRERLKEAHLAAAHFYHQQLLSSLEAEEVRAYVEKRGLTRETVQSFLIGYSPQRWDGLKRHLQDRGFSLEELQQGGLLRQNESNTSNTYDQFRGRLMFPIWDATGALVGFGARSLDGSNPKYLNSPQTPLFDKSSTLFALDRAKDAIRQEKRAVIVEGYMDAIMAHQRGYRNVVAAMGTSLTEKQVSLLARFTPNFILALDADSAGQAATMRGLAVAPQAMGEEFTAEPAYQGRVRRKQVNGKQVYYKLPEGTANIVAKHRGEIRVLELVGGKDPDDVLREDPGAWEQLVENSLPMMDFVLKSVQQRYDLKTPRGKDDAVNEVLPIIADMASPVERSHYLQRLATLTGVDERTLTTALPRNRPSRAGAARASEQGTAGQNDQGGTALQSGSAEVLEDYCLSLLFRFDYLRPQGSALEEEHFQATETRELFRHWLASADGWADELPELLLDRWQRLIDMPLPATSERMLEAALAECIHRLEDRRLREIKHLHRLQMSMEQDQEDSKEAAVLAYVRWKGAGTESAEIAREIDSSLTDVQEKEVLVNQKLQEMMKLKHSRAQNSP